MVLLLVQMVLIHLTKLWMTFDLPPSRQTPPHLPGYQRQWCWAPAALGLSATSLWVLPAPVIIVRNFDYPRPRPSCQHLNIIHAIYLLATEGGIVWRGYSTCSSMHTLIAEDTTVVAAMLIPALENFLKADIPVSPACVKETMQGSHI